MKPGGVRRNLADLEALFLDGNQLSGCVPQILERITNLDAGSLPLCGE